MAAFAFSAVGSAVFILLPMTAVTILAQLFVRDFFPMAGVAVQPFVAAFELEFGLSIVIEHPYRPSVRRMTRFTLLRQTPIVRVITGVTGDALGLRILIFAGEMALFTGQHVVLADQGEMGQVMVEKNFRVPAISVVAPDTCLALLLLMHVIIDMTGDAGGFQRLFLFLRRGMTSLAR